MKDKDYFVITTNVDGQFAKAGFDTERIFATQGDYAYFQPANGKKKELYHNREWVERALLQIRDCRFNRDYPQSSMQLPRHRFTAFAEDLPQIMNHLTSNEIKDVTDRIRISA